MVSAANGIGANFRYVLLDPTLSIEKPKKIDYYNSLDDSVIDAVINSTLNVQTTTTTTTELVSHHYRYFGSWGDFAIISKKPNVTMSSGVGFTNQGLEDNGALDYCDISPLTIRNDKCKSSELGNSDISVRTDFIERIVNRYVKANATREEKTAEVITTSGVSKYTFETLNLWRYGGVFNPNTKPIVIYSIDDITITEDITYADLNYSSIAVPQVIIIADEDHNINIAKDVSRVDAWLLATGEVRTCTTSDGTVISDSDLTNDRCTSQLRINGPVVAKRLLLRRTYTDTTGNAGIQKSAEVVNFSPSALFFGVNEASRAGQPITTYLHELAPRY